LLEISELAMVTVIHLFYLEIYDNQSATTMQKSIHSYSVPKGPRFVGMKYNGVEPSYHVTTCF
jgi:hypothetical protein